MVAFSLETLSEAGYQWLYFAIMLLMVVAATGGVFAWLKLKPRRRKRKRRHQGHGHINPTLAQMGGLPEPKRPDHSQPPQNPPGGSPA